MNTRSLIILNINILHYTNFWSSNFNTKNLLRKLCFILYLDVTRDIYNCPNLNIYVHSKIWTIINRTIELI